MIQGVIFDLDGVLVSTDELHYRSWKELADAESIPFDRQTNERLRGVSRMDSLDIVLERADRPYTDGERSAMAQRKNERYRQLLGELTTNAILPGAIKLVHGLRRLGVPVAVASGSKNARLILDRLGLTDLFDAIVDGGEIARSKPDPEIFLLAASRLGVEPGRCVVVEDAAVGVKAARRADMKTVGVRVDHADVTVSDLSKLSAEEVLSLE